ncbi:hypothetical protein CAC42_7542 [Sphaceloma murrayae]|uniref:Uncharacterized protein n=1 Tax=Sphaceloma murrayae TaxID=2082308 RepID=A0A2K1QXB0_9PEZI|nr:hypothetical protein CAC42_7542 [Sphaceloma murrayae]
MAGVLPATTIKFFVYGNLQKMVLSTYGRPEDDSIVHAQSAMAAAIATATLTNPIWVVKTRLQLDMTHPDSALSQRYRNSLNCFQQILRREGLKALYSGLSASYLGSFETVLHLVLYERLKSRLSRTVEGNLETS